MQEHIRRAHPDYYIPKLPATEESFQLMISTPPSQRPQPPQARPPLRGHVCVTYWTIEVILLAKTKQWTQVITLVILQLQESRAIQRTPSQLPGAAHAAVALTQLHHWDSDFVSIHWARPTVTARTTLIPISGCVPRPRLQTRLRT